jgi:phosphoenolpyruvate carboxylase
VFTRLPVTRKLSVCACFRLNDWDSPSVDVVPLFESIDDLSTHTIMEQLYSNPVYNQHLGKREMKTIMLGFSDAQRMEGI